MTYVLHYAPDNASLIVRLVLEEMGLPYDTTLVDRSIAAQQSESYRAINPAGLIPALKTPDGILFETAAILLWLADRHRAMAPTPDSAKRGDFLKWLFFTSNTLHAQLRMLFYPAKYLGEDDAAQSCLYHTLTTRHPVEMTLPNALDLLNDREARQEGDADRAPDVLDYYIASILRWCGLYPRDATGWFRMADYPALHARVRCLEDRRAVAAAQAAEGLGPTPFSNPVYATPSIGSAV